MPMPQGTTIKRLSNTQQAQASRYLRENDPEKYQHKTKQEAARLLSRDLGFYVPPSQVNNVFLGAGLDFLPAKKQRAPAKVAELRAEVAELKVRVATLEESYTTLQERMSRLLGTRLQLNRDAAEA